MSYNLTQEDMSEFMHSASAERDYIINLPHDIGSIVSEKKIVTEDILFFKSNVQTQKNVVMQSHQKMNGLYIGILLDGEVTYKDNLLDHSITLHKNEVKISYINEFDMTTTLGKTSCGIGLFIKNDFLEKNFKEILDLSNYDNKHFSSTTLKYSASNSVILAKELFQSPFKGGLHNLYIQSKILDIIYSEFKELSCYLKDTPSNHIKLTQEDIAALHKAKEIILNSKEFPDILTLSKKVALNEFKLKYGFKKLFHTTPGNMILHQKMLYAKKLLQNSELSINEISNFVGYKHQQSFTTAFVRYFKVRPKDVMKERRYYY
ncbi:helix-turn-helix domain-containing protein [Candidatus Marinarcus aquaticus]|uniref:AraC family transcriptional regulator n=1 Tax=Candidatus Marinarcus aquaticus TaxID=2044504 RepID=A0A4Q0XQ46_9BACT|nr:AraC family transcriptional regulator [Candidatus Marinarcus aquaticus]RXJ57654.1 AraC family transcriptional regulator [Candidatus Marinarcus aquaticus]